MDEAKEGVVLFSLGSNIKSSLMPMEKIQMILEGFSRLPQKILWKFETDKSPQLPPNVNVSHWLPQSDLLGQIYFFGCFQNMSAVLNLNKNFYSTSKP